MRIIKKSFWRQAVLGGALIFAVFLLNKTVFAQQATSTLPLIYDLSASPGETVRQQTVVTNFRDQEIEVQGVALDFEIVSEEGGVRFANIINENHKLASWIRILTPRFTLKKGETKEVDFEILVPNDAAPGPHWAMLFFQGFNIKGDKTIENLDYATALVLLTVKNGDFTERAEIKSFKAIKNKDKGGVDLVLRISNTGNSFLKPKGTMTIYNIWGKKIGEVTLAQSVVFPETISKIVTTFQPQNPLSIGLYKIVLKGYYGTRATEFNQKTTFLVLPWEAKWPKYFFGGLVIFSLIYFLLRALKIEIKIKKRTGKNNRGIHS